MGAPMRFKCFAALVLSVALFTGCSHDCGSTKVTYTGYYPVTSEFDVKPEDWCIDYFGPPAVPYEQCITYYIQNVVIKLTSHYNIPLDLFRYCFLDQNGNYGLIQSYNYDKCLEIHNFEDIARDYGPR